MSDQFCDVCKEKQYRYEMLLLLPGTDWPHRICKRCYNEVLLEIVKEYLK